MPTSHLPPDFVDALRNIVGAESVREADAVALLDPGWHPDNLSAGLVVSPQSTAEVASILKLCQANDVAVVAQGGRTGLVGGSISQAGELILSSSQMCEIERIDPQSGIAIVQAGCTLQALQEAASEVGFEPGIDLAARGSATIGGMVSTNAGGVMAFRNGVMRHRVLGLEAVLPDGSVYSDLTQVVKHSAGYDLKHLFIGAEGTLGIVTRIVIKLDPLPAATATAMFSLPSVAAALALLRLALEPPAGHLRAAEALWQKYIRLTAEADPLGEAGMELNSPIYLLLSIGGAESAPLQQAFEKIFESITQEYPDTNGVIASSARQEEQLWRLREDTDALYRAHPNAPSYDVSLPRSAIEQYVTHVRTGLRSVDLALEPYIFGHLADGNLHIILNCTGPIPAKLSAQVEHVLYAKLPALGGSFSAEHGVGSKRIESMLQTSDPGKIALMRRVKVLIDGQETSNPGKIFRSEKTS